MKERFRKIISSIILVLVLALLCTSCSCDATSEFGTFSNTTLEHDASKETNDEEQFEFTVQAGKIRIDYVKSSDGEIKIPERLHGFSVSEIAYSAFYQNDCTSVCLPSSLHTIQSAAFYRCHNIRDIMIPSRLTLINGNPFYRCSELQRIYVQSGNVNYFDIDGVLYDLTKTTLIAYPEGRREAIYEIPNGVIKIEDSAFGYNNAYLKIVVIPESVVEFPDYNLFENYDHISFAVTAGSVAEEYATRYGIKLV